MNALFGQSTSSAFAYPNQVFNLDAAGLPQVLANPTTALGVVPKQYVDAAGATTATITNGGAGSAFTGTLSPAITAYVLLAAYTVKWTQASQGGDTVALNGLAALTVKKLVGGAYVNLAAGDIPAGGTTELIYDGTNLNISMGPLPSTTLFLPQQKAFKPSPQSVTNSTVLVNDNDLVFPVAASEIWQFTFLLYCSQGSPGGLDIAMSMPPGGGSVYGVIPLNTIASLPAFNHDGGRLTVINGGVGAGSALSLIYGSCTNSVTSGNLQLQWAQNTSGATPTQLLVGSMMTATRMKP